MPSDIDDIGIGLTLIVMTGRHNFELEGDELIDFVRRSIYALLKSGGKPRHRGSPSDPDRNIPLHYGKDTDEEIVEGVIADWLASGAGDLEWDDFWFALPGTIDDERSRKPTRLTLIRAPWWMRRSGTLKDTQWRLHSPFRAREASR